MAMRVLLSGASGMIGTALRERLEADGYELRQLVRREPRSADDVRWDPAEGVVPAEQIEWADAVVSLSGASLSRLPWTPGYRQTILTSRVSTTGTIAAAIATAQDPPSVWINASAVGYYGRGPTREPFTESSPKGSGFLADTVAAWEVATRPAQSRTRVVRVRTGIVLGPSGALAPLALAAKLGLGTTFGLGMQHWPWVSLHDEARAIAHLLTSELSGPVNIAAPRTNTAADVSQAVADHLNRPNWLTVPRFAARAALGTAADEMLLADQPVTPKALLDDGFRFDIDDLDDAVAEALDGR